MMGQASKERVRTVPQEVKKDRGANLVEFAILMPLLLLLLIGIVEFGWVFAQNLDVRHGAREGARLAAVNFPDGEPLSGPPYPPRVGAKTDILVSEICDRMQTPTGVEIDISSNGSVGDAVMVEVTAPANTLTGFLDWAIPPTLILDSDVETRLEQPASWANTVDQPCP
jgi:hypothetical protein